MLNWFQGQPSSNEHSPFFGSWREVDFGSTGLFFETPSHSRRWLISQDASNWLACFSAPSEILSLSINIRKGQLSIPVLLSMSPSRLSNLRCNLFNTDFVWGNASPSAIRSKRYCLSSSERVPGLWWPLKMLEKIVANSLDLIANITGKDSLPLSKSSQNPFFCAY